MSDGKMRSKDNQDLSAFEILSNVDRKYASAIARMEKLEKSQGDIKDLQGKVEELAGKLQDEIGKLYLVLRQYFEGANEFFNKIDSVNKNGESNQAEIISFHAKFKDFQREIKDLSDAIDPRLKKFEDRLMAELSQFVKYRDFQDEKNAQGMNHKEHKSNILELKKSHASLQSNLNNAINAIKQNEDVSFSNSQRIGSLKDEMDKHKHDVEHKITGLANLHLAKLSVVSSEVEKALKAAKDDMLGSPSSLKSTKDEIYSKFDTVSLDANNALLKAGNVDTQVKVLERKIENLQLQIKKLELAKQ